MLQKKVIEEIKIHILCSRTSFQILAVYEIMWKHKVEPGRSPMTIWRTRITCWIIKVTDINSEYVILIVFTLQQWLHKGA